MGPIMLLVALFLCRLLTLVVGQASCGRESIPYLLSVDLNGKPGKPVLLHIILHCI